MMDFCILGSGVSGSTIANLLSKKYSVHVFDKARGSGGRSSNKKLKNNLSFDHGLQYISPKDKDFSKFIQKLIKKKILKSWNGNHLDFSFEKKEISPKIIGGKANNDLSKYLLKNIKKSFSSPIIRIEYKKKIWKITLKNKIFYEFKRLIITCPYPQLKKLSKKYLDKKILNLKIKMQPNITVMIAIKGKSNSLISSIKFNDDILAWVANENSKNRFKSNINLWTLQASLKWSIDKINKYKSNNKVINELISRFLKLTGYKKNRIIYKKIHGWKYSYSYNSTNMKSLWNKKYQFGVCGDWFLGPKAEHAWISAVSLFQEIHKKT